MGQAVQIPHLQRRHRHDMPVPRRAMVLGYYRLITGLYPNITFNYTLISCGIFYILFLLILAVWCYWLMIGRIIVCYSVISSLFLRKRFIFCEFQVRRKPRQGVQHGSVQGVRQVDVSYSCLFRIGYSDRFITVQWGRSRMNQERWMKFYNWCFRYLDQIGGYTEQFKYKNIQMDVVTVKVCLIFKYNLFAKNGVLKRSQRIKCTSWRACPWMSYYNASMDKRTSRWKWLPSRFLKRRVE